MNFQEIAEFILKFINAITPIIIPLVPVFMVAAGVWANNNKKAQDKTTDALTITQGKLADAQAAIVIHTDKNDALEKQQGINIQHIEELELTIDRIQSSQKKTNDENARLSKLAEQSKRDTDELKKRLSSLQEEYDAFKKKAIADKSKSDEEKRADMLIILGLRTELEKAHGDAKQAQEDAKRWHDQSDKYETDYQKQMEITVRIEALYKEVVSKLERLMKQTDKLIEESTPSPDGVDAPMKNDNDG